MPTTLEHPLFDFSHMLSLVGGFALFALIPFVFVLMTSFTRISIILTFLRQALSTSVPSAQIIIGLSLILTGYVMHPVFSQVYDKAIKPYMESSEKKPETLVKAGWPPLQEFMLHHTREKDLALFLDMTKLTVEQKAALNADSIPWYCLIPAFVISELRMAFMLGFLLFLPFLIIDMVVSSLLMSLGMVMLPPTFISFPFKILLFVVVDGWHLLVQQLVNGYQT